MLSVNGIVRSHLVCDTEVLFGVCLQFAVPDLFGPQGLEKTKFSWLGAWGMKEGVETVKKMGMLGGTLS